MVLFFLFKLKALRLRFNLIYVSSADLALPFHLEPALLGFEVVFKHSYMNFLLFSHRMQTIRLHVVMQTYYAEKCLNCSKDTLNFIVKFSFQTKKGDDILMY